MINGDAEITNEKRYELDYMEFNGEQKDPNSKIYFKSYDEFVKLFYSRH